MKLGILKLGASITWNKVSKTAANFDIHSLVDLLRENPENDINIVTRKTRNTIIPKDMTFIEIMTTNINAHGFDALLVFNGNVNFFGGGEAPDQIMNYVHINKFRGPIIYVHTDGQLQLKQLWPAIECKPWASNWKKEDIEVTRNDIIYLTQARRNERVVALTKKNGSVPVISDNIYFFPIEKAILCDEKRAPVVQRPKVYDLIYGGSMRGGQRKKLLEKYYFHNNVTSHIFGAIKSSMLNAKGNTTFGSKVDHHQFMSKMTLGKATCIIGDEWYFDNMHTLRIYETILASVVCFISKEFDPKMKIFENERLRKFLYVSSASELASKIQHLDESTINEIVRLQLESVTIDRNSYIDRLHGTISEIIRSYNG
jgi:hypothetical protein